MHARWEDIYEHKHIAWLAEQHLDYEAEQKRDDFTRLDLWCEAQDVSLYPGMVPLPRSSTSLSFQIIVPGTPNKAKHSRMLACAALSVWVNVEKLLGCLIMCDQCVY